MGIKGKINESTLRMKDGFMDDYQNGLYIPEIAKKYGVSERTVYLYLGKIAEKAGVSRESLLVHPTSGRVLGAQTRKSIESPPGPEEFHKHLDCVLNGIKQMKCIVKKELTYQESKDEMEEK